MKSFKKILVSNIELPSNLLGSWVNRISYLIEKDPDFFDYILSPKVVFADRSVFCSKKKWISYHPIFYKFQLMNWVAKDYISAITKILTNTNGNVKVVVMDDLVICEAIAILKGKYPNRIELTYSYHGHVLLLPDSFGFAIDKIFFLTNLGYLESLNKNMIFSPEVFIVGNGVRTDKFFPLDREEKIKVKTELGFSEDDEIILWMANSRPAKGLHIFKKIVSQLLINHPDLKILIIGNQNEINFGSTNVIQLGRLSHDVLPTYLQISDYYFFTSLWKEGFGLSLVEAIKCGLMVLSSANGGIVEVVEGCNQVELIAEPNKSKEWVRVFEKMKSQVKPEIDFEYLRGFHAFEDWEAKFKSAILS